MLSLFSWPSGQLGGQSGPPAAIGPSRRLSIRSGAVSVLVPYAVQSFLITPERPGSGRSAVTEAGTLPDIRRPATWPASWRAVTLRSWTTVTGPASTPVRVATTSPPGAAPRASPAARGPRDSAAGAARAPRGLPARCAHSARRRDELPPR